MKVIDFVSAAEALGRPVAYYPGLRRVCKSVTATIFACQLIYWSDKGAAGDGWVYKEAAGIAEETGLSYEEQKTARRHLVDAGLLEERYDRINHRMFYRLNRERFNELMNSPSGQCHIPEHGNATFGNKAMPCSLNESEITTETTTSAKIAKIEQPPQPQPASSGSGQQAPAARSVVADTRRTMERHIQAGTADIGWGFAALAAGESVQFAQPSAAQQFESDVSNALLFLAEDVRQIAAAYMRATGHILDKAHRARDVKSFREMLRQGVTPAIIADAAATMRKQGLTIAAPHSVTGVAISQVAKQRQRAVASADIDEVQVRPPSVDLVRKSRNVISK